MLVAGYIISLLIGLVLGTIGGGGSILTVPVLIYLFGLSPVLATSYSLFIVGVTSCIGAVRNLKHNHVNHRIAILFGGTSTLVVLVVRRYLLPWLATKSVIINKLVFPYSLVMMLVFSLFMLAAAWLMIADVRIMKRGEHVRHEAASLIGIGILLGLVTGFIGIGGGFIIVPSLVLILNLPMKEAVGTSLAIITFTTLVGFITDTRHVAMDWPLLLSITAVSLTGLLTGNIFSRKLPALALKKIFGWFVLVVGCFILVKEVLLRIH